MSNIEIIDGHINLASTKFVPRRFVETTASNMHSRVATAGKALPKEKLTAMMLAQYMDHSGETLLKEMDGAGITKAVLLAPDFSQVADCEITPLEVIQCHHEIMQKHPDRFVALVGVDPRSGPDTLKNFDEAITRYRFAGMKLYPPAGYSPSDRRLYPFYEICAANKVPVLTHTGPGWHDLDFKLGHPMEVDQASRDFPGVNFILGHGAVSYSEDATYLCMYRENMYMDMSGFPAVISADGWEKHMNRMFRLGINHKILFGSSWPASRMSISLKKMLEPFIHEGEVFSGVSKADQRLIMSTNAKRIIPYL